MKITTTTEIEHLGDSVNIKISMTSADFMKFCESIKKAPKTNGVTVKTSELDLAGKKMSLFKLIKKFKDDNPGLHPIGLYKQFYAYWSEPSKNGKNIRYEGEKYFELGKRLATFRRNIKPEEMSKLWEEHNKQEPATKLV